MLQEIYGIEQQSTPEQTLNTFRVASDMFIAGKELAFERMNTYPFVPTIQELSSHVTKAVPEYLKLTEWQRSFLLANGLMHTHAVLARRAEYQTKWMRNPEQVKGNLLSALERATDWELKLNPSKVDFQWSLFSLSLVAETSEFDKIRAHYFGGRKAYGFISSFATELGRMPFVWKRKNYKSTIWHEDIHVWQDNMDYDFYAKTIPTAITERAARDQNIQSGDLLEAEIYFDNVLMEARVEMRIELPAYLWSKRLPQIEILDNPKYNSLDYAMVAMQNTIYSKASGLTEKQKLEKHFQTLMKISKVYLERHKLMAIAKKGMKEYKGDQNRWDWAAARTTVLPQLFSQQLYKAVILGRHSIVNLKLDPETYYSSSLAAALATHARRAVHPEPYGQGGEIPKELVSKFWDTISNLYNNKALYADMFEQYGISRDILNRTRQEVIRYAAKSVPKGFRGKTKRELNERLEI